ncbi:MAG: AAA family ATPase [Bacteroidota bacterium]|nr:AAA family ATPase [Bacteroidota bacterium]
MIEVPLKNQIIDWLKNQYYWLQYAGNEVLEGIEINDALIDTAYKYFKEDFKLTEQTDVRTPITFNEIAVASGVASKLKLLSINSIENVNALVTGQEIAINENLTLIYGENGTGKSGYIRLLNNAFSSRGDKNILGNVYDVTVVGKPKCKFVFQSEAAQYSKEFPTDVNCVEFSKFAVFDTHSIKVHLDGDNQLNFTPSGFEFFDKVVQLFEVLKKKLGTEILSNQPINNFLIHFQNENVIKTHISVLGVQSNEEELKRLGTFTEEDAKNLEEISAKIAALKALNIKEQIAFFEKLLIGLTEFMLRQQAILSCLTEEKIKYYSSLIKSFHSLQGLSKAEGIKSLEQYKIDLIGSSQWREFIVAAKNYTSAIEQSRKENTIYPSDKDHCVFCLQPLTEQENILINTYWQFLKSEAEKELNRTARKIKEAIKELKGLGPIKFDDSVGLYVYLNTTQPALTAKWKGIASNTEKARQNIIANLDNLNNDLPTTSFIDNTNEFDKVVLIIKVEIDALFAKKQDQEIATLTFQMLFLMDKSLLSKLLPEFLKFISAYKWAAAAEQTVSAFKTNSITALQGNLFTQHITNNYSTTFSDECTILKAPNVVEISQHNAKAVTYRKLLVAKQSASQILSEGEQRAISLADFLTEVQLNPNNTGVIFDDPVTSLDHKRRAIIAKRLVELSVTKQVIVFTHDIAFFAKLTSYADKTTGLKVTKTSMRKFGDTVGIIKPDLPWVAQKITARIGFLRNELVKLKKMEKEGEEDQYNMQVKGWYGMLRETWERSVEERLFKGAIERFSGEIHTKPLERIEVTPELVKMIDEGMTQSSNWVHDQAMGLNPPIPDSAKAENDLNYLEAFAEKCKAN